MPEKLKKQLFIVSALILLPLLVITGRKSGISCDEVLHYNHSVAVYNYFATGGADTSALWTPVTNLRHYGQSYDNIVTVLTRWFGIDDIYSFRHIMSSIAGWAVIVVTALFAVWLGGYRMGLIVLFLFAVSPTFIGHSWNNLKDVPFALGYIASIFLMQRFLLFQGRVRPRIIILLTLAMGFTLSIRAGGLLVFCYLPLFSLAHFAYRYYTDGSLVIRDMWIRTLQVLAIIASSWILGILLWPYALQSPVANVLDSYRVMAHFPDTFRQIFEGKVMWSDYMPWYYLPKSMLITIPFVVFTGIVLFSFFFRKVISGKRGMNYLVIMFTILFPLVFVIIEKSNLYSSWRQFLFIYPPLILLAAAGIDASFKAFRARYLRVIIAFIIVLLSIHPVRYMVKNLPYTYIYYNQLTGGTAGAYGQYELDYYFCGQTPASEWLKNYLRERGETKNVRVKATYSVSWQFRDMPGVQASFFRWEERSMEEWDYAIVTNRYIPPFQLVNDIWPPGNTIHTEYADGVPVCAVVKRISDSDLKGYKALIENDYDEAASNFEMAIRENEADEMIFYNFAAALVNKGDFLRADSLLKSGLMLNPDCDQILMYLGNIAKAHNRMDEAATWYRRLIRANMKYFEAYVALSGILKERDLQSAREVLKNCLVINPGYKPAITALAETYRESDPATAAKYDELAKRIN